MKHDIFKVLGSLKKANFALVSNTKVKVTKECPYHSNVITKVCKRIVSTGIDATTKNGSLPSDDAPKKWGHYVDGFEHKILKHNTNGNIYLCVQFATKARNYSFGKSVSVYYIDGVMATDEQVAIIKQYQYAQQPLTNKWGFNTIGIDKVVSIRQSGIVWD